MLNKYFTLIDTYRGNPVHENRKIDNFTNSSLLMYLGLYWLHLLTENDTTITDKKKIWLKEKGLEF